MRKTTLILAILMLATWLAVAWSMASAQEGPQQAEGAQQGDIIDLDGTEGVWAAYALTGPKWSHQAITYSCGNAVLAAAVRAWANESGLVDGGCSSTPDISLQILEPWPYTDGTAGYASWQGTNTVLQHCTITVPLRNQAHTGVILHEVGHCLGLNHSADRNATMYPYCCAPIGPDDIAGIQALYGPGEAVTPTPSAPPTRTPTATVTPGGCASSIWQDADGTVHGPYFSCGPYRLFVPMASNDR